MRPNRTLLLAPLLVALAACPDPGKSDGGEAPVGSSGAAAPGSATPTTATEPKDPLAGSVFKREEVLELFFAEQAAGRDPRPETEAERLRVLKKHGLVDDQGREVPARARAYERALQALAQDAEAWAAEVERGTR